ncbi:tripartite motif-containing protein 2-like [Ptychodera flava]|uniref:tripartite motif-containing protein 2-like n=1 Tax=Ptychodera flava TaxID=63121 RepID=UPI00396A96EE
MAISTRVGEIVRIGDISSRGFPTTATLKKPDGSVATLQPTPHRSDLVEMEFTCTHEGTHELSYRHTTSGVEFDDSLLNIEVYRPWSLTQKFGEYGSGVGQLWDPWGVTVNAKGDCMVTDSRNNRIVIFDAEGRSKNVWRFDNLEKDFFPRQVAIAANKLHFITDGSRWLGVGNNHVVVCDENGRFIRSFGQQQLQNPCGIAVDSDKGIAYVVDNCDHRVQLFNIFNGGHIKHFSSKGNEKGKLDSPRYIALNNKGQVLITDCNNHRIQVFTADGEFLFTFGDQNESIGGLNYPEGIAVDTDGNVYVCDCSNDRVVKFDDRGRFICRIDSSQDDLRQPAGIDVTMEVLPKAVVVDYGNDCVKVYQ